MNEKQDSEMTKEEAYAIMYLGKSSVEVLEQVERYNLNIASCKKMPMEGTMVMAAMSFYEDEIRVSIPGAFSNGLWRSGENEKLFTYFLSALDELKEVVKEIKIAGLSERINQIVSSLTLQGESSDLLLELSDISKELGQLETEKKMKKNKEDNHE